MTELLFFASVGDLRRCQRIVRLWNLKVHALHALSACASASKWLWDSERPPFDVAHRVAACCCRSRTRPAATMTGGRHCEPSNPLHHLTLIQTLTRLRRLCSSTVAVEQHPNRNANFNAAHPQAPGIQRRVVERGGVAAGQWLKCQCSGQVQAHPAGGETAAASTVCAWVYGNP